jgi:tight adherence protein C
MLMINITDPKVQSLILVVLAFILLGVLILVFGLTYLQRSRNKVASRLDHYVSDRKTKGPQPLFQRILPREISGSIFNRLVPPLIEKISNFLVRIAPTTQLVKLDHDLAIAGNPGGMKASGFMGMQVLFVLVGALLAILLVTSTKPIDSLNVILGALALIVIILMPRMWLNSRVKNVKDEVRRALPDALDMLSVCSSAGLGFDQSMQKISIYWHSKLGDELRRTIHEMEMGVTRSAALQSLADRLSVEELSSFIAIIIQAEKMGMSYAEVLHSQAEQMRILRQYRAREIANKLPAKMIVPLALFIFPALIAVILGPVIPTLGSLFK